MTSSPEKPKPWFAVVSAEANESTPDYMQLNALAFGQSHGMIMYTASPIGISIVLGAHRREDVEISAKMLVNLLAFCQAHKPAARLTDKPEEILPAPLARRASQ